MNLENIYSILPSWAKNIAINLEGYKIKRTRYSPTFFRLLKEAKKRTYWSKDEIVAFRNKRLSEFVVHCYESVPYYRRKFKEIGINPKSINTLEDLKYIPILTKDEVKEHFNEFISEIIPKNKMVMMHTSGTTGGGFHFYTTLDSIYEQWAIWWRYRNWHGINMKDWCLYFGGRKMVNNSQNKPPFWRYNIPGKQILFDGYHMSPENLFYYVKEIKRRKIVWLHGYPSLLSLLASYIIENNIDIGYKMKYITIGGENLMPQQSLLIKKAFGIQPKQHYGLAEGVANISECEYGNLHVDEDFSAVEFIPIKNTSSYKIIGTNFSNLAMPLIRYDTQDIATISSRKLCQCKNKGRIVTKIDGRKEDYIILKNGIRIGRLAHLVADLINIKEAQIYQKKIGEIIIKIVKSAHYTEKDEIKLVKEFKKRIGDNDKIYIEYVKYLPRTHNGKLRFVKSELKEGKLVKNI